MMAGDAPATAPEVEGRSGVEEGHAPPSRCQHTGEDGVPCAAPPQFIQPNGWCWIHSPDPEHKAGREQARKLAGARSAARLRKGINPANLGPLNTPEDAERWCVVAGLAVATGQITPAAGATIRSLVGQFLQAQEAGAVRKQLQELAARVEGRSKSLGGRRA